MNRVTYKRPHTRSSYFQAALCQGNRALLIISLSCLICSTCKTNPTEPEEVEINYPPWPGFYVTEEFDVHSYEHWWHERRGQLNISGSDSFTVTLHWTTYPMVGGGPDTVYDIIWTGVVNDSPRSISASYIESGYQYKIRLSHPSDEPDAVLVSYNKYRLLPDGDKDRRYWCYGRFR